MYHYTDVAGHKGIVSDPVWRFIAQKPPGENPIGAYFTSLSKDAKNICARLRIPRSKTKMLFEFLGNEGLQPLAGGRGEYIFWSPVEYFVVEQRQVYNGPTEVA